MTYQLTLTFSIKSLNPDDATKTLGTDPTISWLAGQSRKTGLGVYRDNGWILKREFTCDELNDALIAFIGSLGPRTHAKAKLIADCGGYIRAYVDSDTGEYLDHTVITLIADWGLGLDLHAQGRETPAPQ